MAKRLTELEKLDIICVVDRKLWRFGKVVLGMDEAGRGPLAGPVVAAAVVMPKDDLILGINDSKKIVEKKRERLYSEIQKKAIAIGVGIVDNTVIDDVNILNATRMVFKAAFEQINVKVDAVISDYITGLDIGEYTAIKKGDSKSYTIACASIVAKVTRDSIMKAYDDEYRGYNFSQHKGYGTKKHYAAIEKLGISEIHRKTFLKNINNYE